jgi:hypothetical protein
MSKAAVAVVAKQPSDDPRLVVVIHGEPAHLPPRISVSEGGAANRAFPALSRQEFLELLGGATASADGGGVHLCFTAGPTQVGSHAQGGKLVGTALVTTLLAHHDPIPDRTVLHLVQTPPNQMEPDGT